CRQLVHRARTRLRDERKPMAVAPETQRDLLQAFAQAASSGDFTALKSVLAAEAQLVGDGGGKVPSFGVPLRGGQRIAQLYLATFLRCRCRGRCDIALAEGQWRLLRFVDGKQESAQFLETDGTRITRIHAQHNPYKLAQMAHTVGCELTVLA